MTHPVDEIVGRNIAKYRMLRNYSRQQIGNALGISHEQIRKIELAVNRISAAKLLEIAHFLGVRVSKLYEGASSEMVAGHIADNLAAKLRYNGK